MSVETPVPEHGVEILALPGVELLDIAGPAQVLSSANRKLAEAGRAFSYCVRVVTPDGNNVPTATGIGLPAECAGAHVPFHTLVIANGFPPNCVAPNPRTVDWVRDRANQAERIAALSCGAFLLAATGLLEGRRTAVHWSLREAFVAAYPGVLVEEDAIFVRDEKFWSSAGVSTAIDLALAFVEDDVGREIARAVAHDLIVPQQRPGHHKQSNADLLLQGRDERFGFLHAWIRENLRENLHLSVLARQIGMSERSFLRHYRRVTGTTPGRAVEDIRLQAACDLLVGSDLSIKRIADQAGFGTEEILRRAFRRRFGVSPTVYREEAQALSGKPVQGPFP